MDADSVLLRRLLAEGESGRLDYKSQQYAFPDKAPEEKKAELLKDVLAMANAWRESDAYILIGVQEVPGEPARAVGIDHHLDDANLQQFVNSKVKRPIRFSYREVTFAGKTVGIIHVPVQQRPFFLVKPFGNLRSHVVYLRRGTSTTEAEPDEIYEMGYQAASSKRPSLQLQFANLRERVGRGTEIQIGPIVLDPLSDDELPTVRDWETPMGIPVPAFDSPNRQYYRELRTFLMAQKGFASLGFMIENLSSVLAEGVRATLELSASDDVALLERMPSKPARIDSGFRFAGMYMGPPGDVVFDRRGERWHVHIDFGKVQPHSQVWTTDSLIIGIGTRRTVTLTGNIYGDNIDPIPTTLTIHSEPEVRKMTLEDLSACEAEGPE